MAFHFIQQPLIGEIKEKNNVFIYCIVCCAIYVGRKHRLVYTFVCCGAIGKLMIYVKWIYKGSVISMTKVNKPHTKLGCDLVKERITKGTIIQPEFCERYVLSKNSDNDYT